MFEISGLSRLRYSPVPVARVTGQAVVEAPLGQRFLLVEDKLLQPHLHLSARHSACQSELTVQEDHKQRDINGILKASSCVIQLDFSKSLGKGFYAFVSQFLHHFHTL